MVSTRKTIKRTMKTHELDATNQSLGRLASKIASLLRGKDDPAYQPNISPNVKVVIKNLDKIKFSGNKMDTKVYYHYSGFPGGMKERSLESEWKKKPQEVLRQSVYRMLPPNRQRDKIIQNLKFQ